MDNNQWTVERALREGRADLPDAPGVWIWKCPSSDQLHCIRVIRLGDTPLFYWNAFGEHCDMDYVSKNYPGGKWQGPIEWEET